MNTLKFTLEVWEDGFYTKAIEFENTVRLFAGSTLLGETVIESNVDDLKAIKYKSALSLEFLL